MPAIRACLEHRHSYVRRNAVLAIYTIYRCVDGSTSERQTSETIFSCSFIYFYFFFRNFEHLIPDAPELIHDFLVNEKDASCKRNAFMMLIHADQVHSLINNYYFLLIFFTRMNLMKLSSCSLTSFNLFLQDRALDYLSTCIDQVHTFGDILQLVIVELIYKVRCLFLYLKVIIV